MKNILLILMALLPILSISQKQGNIWYFGNHAGLDFNGGAPVPLTNGSTYNAGSFGSEGTSVISDSSGTLLFYSNGHHIWNRNHQVMPNGDSLFGNISSTQSALIVPLPGSSRYFYVFTTDDFDNDTLKYGFRYSVVDICLENGLGDVISNQKNIKLLDTVAEKLTAIRHSNGLDYWIITHKYFSDAFYSYHLSSLGIVNTVVSHIGSIHPSSMVGIGGAIGQLKASPNGQKLAIVNGQSAPNIAEYFDFDKNTGIISNVVTIQSNPNYSYYGVSFSPDNSKLYISCWLNNNGVYQFNLNSGGGNADSVLASKYMVSNKVSYAMQLGVDGKIYLAKVANPGNYLAVINNPNNLGLNCNYLDSAVYLNGGTVSMGLPNFVDSYSYSNTFFNCNSLGTNEITLDAEIIVYPNPSNAKFEIETNLKINSIAIYNVHGKLIYFKKNTSKQDNEIDLSSEPNGVYFVIARTDAGIINRKIIVEK